MPRVADNDRDAAEIAVREAVVSRLEEIPILSNVHGRERKPEQDEQIEDIVTVPDPVTQEPIIGCVFVDWSRTDDRQDLTDDRVTTLILGYQIRVVDEFVDQRADGTNSKDGHRRKVLAIQAALKATRHLGFDSDQVYHKLAKMPADTQIIEDDDGSAHLSILNLVVEVSGFRG